MLIRKTYYDDRISDELLQKRLVESKLFAAKIMLMQINAESGLTDCSENPIIALKTDYSTRDEHGRFTGSVPHGGSSGGGSSGGSGSSGESGGGNSPNERLRKMIENGDVTLKLNETIQNRHYQGTNEYNSFLAIGVEKSYFTIPQSELQDFLRKNATKGIVFISSAGDVKERFDFGKVIAYDTLLKKETTWATVTYSKAKTHFSPYSPMPKEDLT